MISNNLLSPCVDCVIHLLPACFVIGCCCLFILFTYSVPFVLTGGRAGPRVESALHSTLLAVCEGGHDLNVQVSCT